MDLTVEQLFANSFVLSIDNTRLAYMHRNFLTRGLPMPRRLSGLSIKSGATNSKILDIHRRGYAECCLAHVELMTIAEALKLPFICIFEDDAFPCRNALSKLQSVLTDMPDDLGVLKLGWSWRWDKRNGTVCADPRYSVVDTWGSHAYVVFRKAYKNQIYIPQNIDLSPDETALNERHGHTNCGYRVLAVTNPIFIQKDEGRYNRVTVRNYYTGGVPNIEDFDLEQHPTLSEHDKQRTAELLDSLAAPLFYG